jgi:putative transposase
VVQYLKGKSSHNLLSVYQSLWKRDWGQHLWGRGYWVATSGNVTDEVWKKYTEDQRPGIPKTAAAMLRRSRFEDH